MGKKQPNEEIQDVMAYEFLECLPLCLERILYGNKEAKKMKKVYRETLEKELMNSLVTMEK